jgi:prevent-host-death family protein
MEIETTPVMPEETTNQNTISSTHLQRNFGQIIHRVFVSQTRITVERDGLPVFALVPLSDLARLQELDRQEQKHS